MPKPGRAGGVGGGRGEDAGEGAENSLPDAGRSCQGVAAVHEAGGGSHTGHGDADGIRLPSARRGARPDDARAGRRAGAFAGSPREGPCPLRAQRENDVGIASEQSKIAQARGRHGSTCPLDRARLHRDARRGTARSIAGRVRHLPSGDAGRNDRGGERSVRRGRACGRRIDRRQPKRRDGDGECSPGRPTPIESHEGKRGTAFFGCDREARRCSGAFADGTALRSGESEFEHGSRQTRAAGSEGQCRDGVIGRLRRYAASCSVHQPGELFLPEPDPVLPGRQRTGSIREHAHSSDLCRDAPLDISPGQVYVLSDSDILQAATPPHKGVVEAAIKDFCESSRAQDRIVLFWSGHTAEIEGKTYLIPIEGTGTPRKRISLARFTSSSANRRPDRRC